VTPVLARAAGLSGKARSLLEATAIVRSAHLRVVGALQATRWSALRIASTGMLIPRDVVIALRTLPL
jgi:hypothetical protein